MGRHIDVHDRLTRPASSWDFFAFSQVLEWCTWDVLQHDRHFECAGEGVLNGALNVNGVQLSMTRSILR